MDLRELIMTIQDTYIAAKSKPFSKNKTADLIRHGLDKVLQNDLLGTVVKTKGSPGQGRWATIPWLGIFDSGISTSASHGIYVVYLFSEDMQRVYLSLNQAWTFYDKRYKKMAESKAGQVSNYWRKHVGTHSERILGDPIHLTVQNSNVSSSLPSGYELCNIWSICYQKGHLPSDRVMREDLAKMILSLEEVKNKLKYPSSFAQSIDAIVDEGKIKGSKQKTLLVKAKNTRQMRLIKNRDYEGEMANNMAVGDIGERLVVEHEKTALKGFPELQKRVTQVSKDKGDGLGYDVLSFSLKGDEKYIEVKTTTQGKNMPFYMTKNEVMFSKEKENYFLFRIYQIRPDNPKLGTNFFVLKGDVTKKCELSPVTYQVISKDKQ